MIPIDFPAPWAAGLRAAHASGRFSARARRLGEKLRLWKRTARNDPYRAGVAAIRRALQGRLKGWRVVEAYNEFCPPSLPQALENARKGGARRIIVIPTMMTRGGIHSEKDIPEALEAFRRDHSGLSVVYAWPFDLGIICDMLSRQVVRSSQKAS